MTTTINHQAAGFVPGNTSRSLDEANRNIAAAKRETPAELRDGYRSRIRYVLPSAIDSGHRWQGGYEWEWILR